MAERWQSSEARVAAVFFRDTAGAPVTGLTPTATVRHKDGSGFAPSGSVAEVGGGFYRLTFSAVLTRDALVVVDGGASLTSTRYAALEVPVGGYVDLVDVATSTRATHAEATGDTPGVVTLLSRVSAVRAGLLDALAFLDAPVSGRASQASVTALGSPAQTTDPRLTNLDVAVSTRATPADLNVIVGSAPSISSGP